MADKRLIESKLENGLFASRWLMAPMYIGLAFALLGVVIVFFRDLLYYAPQIFTMSGDAAIMAILTLIDLTLAANLLSIVIFSGYENFVSKMDLDNPGERASWMGTVDFSGLKMKLIASIVAISAISLLKRFMEVGKAGLPSADDSTLFWMVVIHITFVISGLLMAAMDWLVARTKKSY